MTIHFTSDLHLGHVRINELAGRPFSSVEEMNEVLIERWNSVVRPEDEVWILGDFVMGKKSETLPLVQRLNGTKNLIPGNHDRVMPDDPQITKWRKEYNKVGIVVHPHLIRKKIGRSEFDLCHFPSWGDSGREDRYTNWRPGCDESIPLLHGHVHEKWRRNGHMLNVGVDVWDFTPINLEQIVEAFRAW